MSKRHNEKYKYCAHSETVIEAGSCQECNAAKAANKGPLVYASFVGPHYSEVFGCYVNSERDLINKAAKSGDHGGTVKWDRIRGSKRF